jgi:3-deoxy-D-manno-octulosonic-acid transferase
VAWIELLRDPERRQKMGENAKHLVDSSRGATDRVVAEISKYLGSPGR